MQALGGDKAFLAWIRTQEKCAADGVTDCAGDIVAAHVRRIASGSGTGTKGEYNAVPMCDLHHQEQHRHGESVVGGKEHFDKQAAKWLDKWSWQALRAQFGKDSMRDVHPVDMYDWAFGRGLTGFLPECYVKHIA